MRAQGAVEYLVILAVVITVALIAVALLTSGLGASGDTKITQSLTYWRGATPIAITQFAAGKIAENNKAAIRNLAPELVIISKITLTQVGGAASTLTYSTPTSVSPGQQEVVEFSFSGTPCTPGIVMEYDVVITYTSGGIGGAKTQTGEKPIAARCY